jgi:hypothetical protein
MPPLAELVCTRDRSKIGAQTQEFARSAVDLRVGLGRGCLAQGLERWFAYLFQSFTCRFALRKASVPQLLDELVDLARRVAEVANRHSQQDQESQCWRSHSHRLVTHWMVAPAHQGEDRDVILEFLIQVSRQVKYNPTVMSKAIRIITNSFQGESSAVGVVADIGHAGAVVMGGGT